MAASDVVVVLTNTGSEDEAMQIARTLVEEGLVACGNVLPEIRSVYRWQGAVEDAKEVPLVLKTTADRVDEVIARVKGLHSYEVPEVIALPVVAGLGVYLDWVRENSMG